MRVKTLLVVLSVAAIGSFSLTACVPLVVGGAVGTTALVTTDRRTTGAQMADNVMESRVHYEITQQIKNNIHLTVTSYNRRILLTGEVGSEVDKQLAGQIARNSLEVLSVVNELWVGPVTTLTQRVSDSTLAGKVRSQIVATAGISLNQMKVTVDRDTVYLMGLVTAQEAAKAANVASRVSGVRSVVTAFEVLSQAEVEERMKLVTSPTAQQSSDPALTTNNVETSGTTTEVRLH